MQNITIFKILNLRNTLLLLKRTSFLKIKFKILLGWVREFLSGSLSRTMNAMDNNAHTLMYYLTNYIHDLGFLMNENFFRPLVTFLSK